MRAYSTVRYRKTAVLFRYAFEAAVQGVINAQINVSQDVQTDHAPVGVHPQIV